MMRALPSIARMESASIQLFASARRDDLERIDAGRLVADVDIAGDRHSLKEAFELAVFGDIDDAVADRLPRHAIAHLLAVERHVTAVEQIALDHAGDDFHHLGAAAADQAEDGGNLPGIDRERGVAHHAAARQILHAQHLAAVRPRRALGGAVQRGQRLRPTIAWMMRTRSNSPAGPVTTSSPSRNTAMRSASSRASSSA
jgi:hypothetical protein